MGKVKAVKTRTKLMRDIKNAINVYTDNFNNAKIVSGVVHDVGNVAYETEKYYFNKEGKVIGVKDCIILENNYKITLDEDSMIIYNEKYKISSLYEYEIYDDIELGIIAYKTALR